MVPITVGVMPFGMVMGGVAHEVGLSLAQSTIMNLIVFAGASQLAAIELMTTQTADLVVVLTGLMINFRFILYSAAMAPLLQQSGFWTRALAAHNLTDQSYAVMTAKQNQLANREDSLHFLAGSLVCMFFAWHGAVLVGFLFGNLAPKELSLDYAVPLSFVSLVLPTMKDRRYVFIAILTSGLSVVLNDLPYRMGLIVTALTGIAVATQLNRRKGGPA